MILFALIAHVGVLSMVDLCVYHDEFECIEYCKFLCLTILWTGLSMCIVHYLENGKYYCLTIGFGKVRPQFYLQSFDNYFEYIRRLFWTKLI